MPTFRVVNPTPDDDDIFLRFELAGPDEVSVIHCTKEGEPLWNVCRFTSSGKLFVNRGLPLDGPFRTDKHGCIVVDHPQDGILNPKE